jgi:glutathione synthase/RimK-type ligase-like ATP-grasp enzyme
MSKPTLPITVVGSKELVDFPDLGLLGVPAKVDTGADSSSIWASEVVEKGGILTFKLFGPASPFYTGKKLTARNFSVSTVKNSFGHTERRYKVRLKMRLATRVIYVRFTLANRENNSHPILVGRRTLHGKFLVDVTVAPDSIKTGRMLMVGVRRTRESNDFIKGVEAAYGPGLKITRAIYDDVRFVFDGSGPRITLASTGEDIASFDLVHFKVTPTAMRDVTATMARYLQIRGIKVVDPIHTQYSGNSKLYQYLLLGNKGIAVPNSFFMMPANLPAAFPAFVEQLGLPFVLKDIHGIQGRANYLIHSEEEYDMVAAEAAKNRLPLIGQTYIPNDGDYRLLVMGGRLGLAIYRWRQDDTTHLNNTSQGGQSREVSVAQLPEQVRIDSLTAAGVMQLGVAGVDMVQDNLTGRWYCLEVNIGPKISSGALLEEKQRAFAQFIKTELRG